MKKRCYLIDENTTPALADQLRRHQPSMTVFAIGAKSAPPKGISDPDLLFWLEENGFSLVTKNRKSMPRHVHDHVTSGHHVPAIFTIRSQSSLGDVVDDLILIWDATDSQEFQDQIIHIPF